MQTLLAARAEHYALNAFGEDGGASRAWDEAQFGPIPYAVPNPPARVRALQVHDFHHVLTGYATDWRSESLISAWELGSGGAGRYVYAWLISLFGFAIGMLALPRATARAFRRGRAGRNLYAEPELGSWHERGVAEARERLSVASGERGLTMRTRDWLLLLLATLAALPVLALTTLLTPLMVFAALARRAKGGLQRARSQGRSWLQAAWMCHGCPGSSLA